MPRSRRFLFVTYAIASYLYRWVVTFSIIYFLSQFLKPRGLQSISYMMAIGSLIPLAGMPLYQMFKFVRTPGRMRKVKKLRAASFAAAAVAVVAGILMIPTPLRVAGTFVLSVSKPEVVYAEVPGNLKGMPVRDGEWVKEGDLIATLSNPEKMRERTRLQSDQETNFAKAAWYGATNTNDSRALSIQHFQMAQDLEPTIQKVSEDIHKLTLVAHRDGKVMGLPHPETLGQHLKPGKPFCEVGDPHKMEAHMILDQGDLELVRLNRRAGIKVYGDSEVTWRGRVSEIAKKNRDEIAPELSNAAGGEIATKQDPKSGQAKPINAVYEIIIPLENPNLILQPGQRGLAKIDGGTYTIGWWLWRLISKTFNFMI
jgi:putative peptide zinc metalloprotease protein